MYGLDNNSGISVMPDIAPTTSPVPLWFTEGGANQSPSYPGQDWHNMMQGELLNVVTESGLVPNKANHKQVAAAIRAMIANSAYVVPVGVPLPWPTSVAPSGWLKCNGAAFDKLKYPILAAAYPSGILPDLRGEFIRGWDDGRGVDSGRALLSTQQASKISGQLYGNNSVGRGNGWRCDQDVSYEGWESVNSILMTSPAWAALVTDSTTGPATGVSRYAGYIRPRNIAFNYIVRAA